jgi:hypothetical protein
VFFIRKHESILGGILNYGCSGVYFAYQNNVRGSVSSPGRFIFAQHIRDQLDRNVSGQQGLFWRGKNWDSSISVHVQATFIINFRASFLFSCFGSRWWVRVFSLSRLSRSHSDTPISVGLFWTNDKPVAVTSAWQHTKFTTEIHPCSRRDSKSQIPESERPQTYALDTAAFGIGLNTIQLRFHQTASSL